MPELTLKSPTDSRVEIAEIMAPNDANFLGKIFGGKILSLIDLCAYAASRKFSGRVAVTASFDRVDFHEPINVGELLTLVGYVSYAGRTSMEVTIEVYADDLGTGPRRHTNTARVTMVALDDSNKPTTVPTLICETREEKVRFLEGKLRRELRSQQRAELDRIASEFRGVLLSMRKLLVIGALALGSLASAQTINTGFESPFTVGDLDGQQGWIAQGDISDSEWQISTAQAASGTQSVRYRGGSVGLAWLGFASPHTTGALISTVSIFFDPADTTVDTVGGLRLFSGAAAGLGVAIHQDGTIHGGQTDLWDTSTIVGSLTGSSQGRWIQLSINYTPGSTSGTVTADGQTFSVSGLSALANVTDADLYTDFVDDSEIGTIYFDNYSTAPVPEPATIACLGMGALALIRRRRAKK